MLGAHAAAAAGAVPPAAAAASGFPLVLASTLFAWRTPVGPQAAALAEGSPADDGDVVRATGRVLRGWADTLARAGGPVTRSLLEQGPPGGAPHPETPAGGAPVPLALVECAGGVASPGPGGALQCDGQRALRLPCLLVADARLGGVSATLCAAEALVARGYDLVAVALPGAQPTAGGDSIGGERADALATAAQLAPHLPAGVPLIHLPPLPVVGDDGDSAALWLRAAEGGAAAVASALRCAHSARLAELRSAPGDALATLWWPFTQHAGLGETEVAVVDSRCGATLALLSDAGSAPALRSVADASCAWWTQGLAPRAFGRVRSAAASALGRYGHAPYPGVAHRPALDCAAQLLRGPGGGWAQRVFFADCGAAAVEVALKMALRASAAPTAAAAAGPGAPAARVLAVAGSYHGDTLGAACASGPSVFTSPRQAPWYTQRAVLLHPPTARLHPHGGWEVVAPHEGGGEGGGERGGERFATLEALCSPARDHSPLGRAYAAAVEAAVAGAAGGAGLASGGPLGCAIIEPLLHGAGGMVLVDPAFHRAIASACAQHRLPLVADEVFSGCWRLGAPSACALLGIAPDVACYGKLLTGGTLPLAATLATEAVWRSFLGGGQTGALLHGHSYAGSPAGCAAAAEALRQLGGPGNANVGAGGRLAPLWRADRAAALAAHPRVARAVAVGTVLAVQLRGGGAGGGYGSDACARLVRGLRSRGVLARPLGDVVYLMVSPMAPPAECDHLLDALTGELDAPSAGGARGREEVC